MPQSDMIPAPAEARLFPIAPNWDERVRASIEYKTDIITAGVGSEQRRAVRDNPRRVIEFTALLGWQERIVADYFMAGALPYPVVIPDPTRHIVLTEELVAPYQENPPDGPYTFEAAEYVSDTTTETPPAWLEVGDTVMVATPYTGYQMEPRTIGGFSANDIFFSDEDGSAFPAYSTVHPVLFGHCRVEPRSVRYSNRVASLPVTFEVIPGSEIFEPTAPGFTLDGLEVLEIKPNWASSPSMTYSFPREVIDYGYGRIGNHIPYDFPARIMKYEYLARDPGEVKYITDFFMRKRGRRNSFLVPTWEDDVPYQAIGGNGRQIVIADPTFGAIYTGSTVFRRILLRMTDGRLLYFKIESITSLPETGSSVITTVERMPIEEISPATLQGISWVLPVRFGSDRLDVDWVTGSSAQVALTFQTLEDLTI
ncbi:hypothetical protein [Amorphus orientalis]|uniref:Uncharacterized protein n=1 Tax=Amorphus orientalis TaxID=649198 RepID=A0AAE4ATX2_9HYPH|nr:hypothetical protein [Amorphus orientalis]MDQ0317726.1 hypothetical protein [Amorphus orientalis]